MLQIGPLSHHAPAFPVKLLAICLTVFALLQAFSLDAVSEQLKKAYRLFTEGKFTNALQGFNQVLWTIPMVVVDSRKEVDELKELITICRRVASGLLTISHSLLTLSDAGVDSDKFECTSAVQHICQLWFHRSKVVFAV